MKYEFFEIWFELCGIHSNFSIIGVHQNLAFENRPFCSSNKWIHNEIEVHNFYWILFWTFIFITMISFTQFSCIMQLAYKNVCRMRWNAIERDCLSRMIFTYNGILKRTRTCVTSVSIFQLNIRWKGEKPHLYTNDRCFTIPLPYIFTAWIFLFVVFITIRIAL